MTCLGATKSHSALPLKDLAEFFVFDLNSEHIGKTDMMEIRRALCELRTPVNLPTWMVRMLSNLCIFQSRCTWRWSALPKQRMPFPDSTFFFFFFRIHYRATRGSEPRVAFLFTFLWHLLRLTSTWRKLAWAPRYTSMTTSLRTARRSLPSPNMLPSFEWAMPGLMVYRYLSSTDWNACSTRTITT